MARRETRYTPRGTTWKPCPACGKEPESVYKIGFVCDECAETLAWAQHERRRYAALQDVEIRTLPSGPSRIKLPYCPGSSSSRTPHHQEYDGARDTVTAAVYALLETVCLATGGAAEIRHLDTVNRNHYSRHPIPRTADSTYHESEKHRKLLLRPEHAALIDELGPQFDIMIRCAYEAGLLDGKSLISQLARGEITLDKLSEADERAALAIQESLRRAKRELRD